MSETEATLKMKEMEVEIASLKKKVQRLEEIEGLDIPWWKKIAGTFADDPMYDEAMRLGREYRLAQREDYDHD